jgi:ABC-type Fe3+ transport system permease subunit
MKSHGHLVWKSMIVLAVAALTALCYHSVEEIHYLKSFFPDEFTVREAFYASVIELVKVAIAGAPLAVIIALCMVALLRKRNETEK